MNVEWKNELRKEGDFSNHIIYHFSNTVLLTLGRKIAGYQPIRTPNPRNKEMPKARYS